MKKSDIIIYRLVTGIFTAHMLFTVFMYFYSYDMVKDMFESLGVSAAIIYPLAIAKLLGLIAIWSNRSSLLKNLAYIGFAADFIMASAAHTMANDGGTIPPLVALVFLVTSFIFNRKLDRKEKSS